MKFCKSIWVALIVILLSAASTWAQGPNAEVLSLIRGERYLAARELINKNLNEDPKNPEWNYLDGFLHYVLEEYKDAGESFKAGIDKKSKYVFNHIGLARVYNVMNKGSERDQVIEKIKSLNKKNDPDINLELTTVLTEAERGDEAKLILYKLRDEIPQNVEVWRKLADYYLFRKVYELAQRNYEKVLELDPNDVRAMLSLGQIYIRDRKYTEGKKMLDKAIELDPNLAPAYKERGELFRLWGSYTQDATDKAERYANATMDYQKYIALLPGDTRAQYRYAQFLYLSGDYEKAIEELNKAQTDSYVKDRLLGYSLIGTGRLDEGKKKLDEYFSRVPEDKTIKEDYDALGRYHMEKGEYDKAIENYRKMLKMEAELNPDNARDADDFFEEMAKNFNSEKDFEKEMIFRQALIKEKEANGIEIPYQRYFNLGLAGYRSKNYETAKSGFEKVTELNPEWESGWFWLGSSVYNLTGGSDAEGWPVSDYYAKVFNLLKETPVDELKNSERSHLQTSAVYMSFATFNPTQASSPTPDQLNCEGAMEYVNKVLELDPENKQVSSINDYCNQ